MTTTPVGYAPDTCSLLAVDKAVASEAEREQLWESLLGPFFLWRLSIVEAVLEELEEKPDQTEARIRPLRGLPAVISRQQQLGEHGVSSLNNVRLRYPRMSGRRRGRERADAWIVALAKDRGLTVVTEEIRGSSKIPTACQHYDVECINLAEFIQRERLC